jgi:signal transduction histidine kinase/CheY-like chemotaxis protein
MKALSKLLPTALLLLAGVSLPPSDGQAQQSAAPKRVLALYWYDKDYPGDARFDEHFKTVLRSAAPGAIEYYSEYLEANRFPEESQPLLLRDYLRQKYAGRIIDVVVTNAPVPLEFLLKHRSELFPNTPIVFGTIERQTVERHVSGPGATGILYAMTHRKTLDLALRLHPDTEQVFIISGTITHDKSSELTARNELQGYENKVKINYLTDLAPEELTARLRSLPTRSIALYARQQFRNQHGKLFETQDVLALIAHSAQVPIYGMSSSNVGLGIIGGYVWTIEANAARLAEMALLVANGVRARDIPIENAPDVPMFDWSQLRRWGISEDRLPPGSIIRFRELTMWQQYKWRIVAAIVLFGLQALLIGTLLVEHYRARRTQLDLQQYKGHLEKLVQKRTAELVEACDQAVAANRAKSLFLANMSHELRTPLNAILGFSDLLRERSVSEEQRKDLDIINRSGEHLLSLINDVLDVAKIEAGHRVLDIAPCDLGNLLRDVTEMMRLRAEEKHLALRVEAPAFTKYVRADAAKLRRVLINLVGNAVKYTERGSVIVRLNTRPLDDSGHVVLMLEIEDTGIGLAAQDQARIFDAFVQVGKAGRQKGTGLGLAITRQCIELMSGTIQVESAPGLGSRFRVEVPVECAQESEIIGPAAELEHVVGLEPGQPEYRVLIVEDERENWMVLERLLRNIGFQVRVAEDGAQGVERFREWRPQFIWMDLQMPVMDGFEATRHIRALEGGREAKIAAVTASVFASQRSEVLAAGLDDYVHKPYRPNEIFDCMARHLGVRYRRTNTAPPSFGEPTTELRPEGLAALPEELRAGLREALLALDVPRIAAIIESVAERDAELGAVLAHRAGRYAYTGIFNAIDLAMNHQPELVHDWEQRHHPHSRRRV